MLLTAPGDQVSAFDATILLALFVARGKVGEVPLLRWGALVLLCAAAAGGRSRGGRGTGESVARGGVDAGMMRLHRG